MTSHLRSTLARTALEAALAGALYGAVEAILVWHLPVLWRSGGGFTRGQLAYSSIVAILFPVTTALLGCGLALASSAFTRARADWPRDDAPRILAAIALSAEIALALVVERHRPAGLLLQSFAVGLAVAGGFELAVPRIAQSLSGMLNAPTAVALLLLPGWISSELLGQRSGPMLRVVPTVVALAIVAIALLVSRLRGPRLRSLRRNALATCAVWAVVLVGGWIRVDAAREVVPPSGAGSSTSRRPNVLLVLLDTVRADHLSLYGCERRTTPCLERLAARSVVFEEAIAPGDMTLSSHASLFTGLAPRSHGAHFDERGRARPLADKFVTLAERLRDAGWSTAGVVANHAFFGNGCGLEQGFASFDSSPPFEFEFMAAAGDAPWFTVAHACHELLVAAAPAQFKLRHYRTAQQITTEGREWLDAATKKDQPFFLFLNLMDAHWPCVPPPPFDLLFPGRSQRFESSAWRYAMVDEVVKRGTRGVTDEERAHMESQYDGAIAYMDAQLGALVEDLERRGLLDNTLLIVTSDHGETFGEHGLVGHAVSVFEEQVHVPLLVRPPGGVDGRRESAAVSLIDIPRTVLAAVGIEAEADVGGLDLLGPTPAQWPACSSESYPNQALGGARLDRVQRALRSATDWKLIRTSGQADALFELHSDPRELRNLATTAAEHAELSKQFDVWLEATPQAPSVEVPDDAISAARLRTLGY